MFRVLTILVGFFILLLAGTGAYQHLVPVEVLTCNEFLTCYTQVVKIFGQENIANHELIALIHSVSAFAIVVLLAMLTLSSLWLKNARLKLFVYTLILAGLVGVQIPLGMHAHWLGTQALNQLAHYLLNAFTLYVLVHIYLHSKTGYVKRNDGTKSWLVSSAIVVLGLQLLLGAWLTANHAGLVCGGFPQCLNSWWPQADYINAFNFLAPLSFDAKIAVHWLHRIFSIIVFISLTWVMLSATSSRIKSVRWAGVTISLLLLIQFAAGIALVKLSMPVWIGVVHSLTAMILMLPLLLIRFHAKYKLPGDIQVTLPRENSASLKERDTHVVDDKVQIPTSELVEPESLYLRLKSQLGKTRTGLGAVLSVVSFANRKIDQDLLEEIETSLLMADVGMDVTTDIIAKLEESVEKHQLEDVNALSELLKQQLLELLEPVSQPLVIPEKQGPYVILVVGVNGAGKTTTIGKLAQRLQQQGYSVMLAAGDTFRAAAVEQLQVWGERNEIHVVAQHTGADSASVIFDAVQSAQAKGIDVLIADTAGRLHTKSNLMDELKKIKRIMSKLDDTAPHEVLLVLDAGTGQNALSQAEHFNKAVELTGIALTKLDGTAKGGIIFALAKKAGVPIRFLGVGEGINDLQDFNARDFIDALFKQDKD
ncbi:signal recognition particle-docking protein FtsY [methanotrophic endosymbiont of Bathymodiolus puteoserpentis (Logatchev)]|jgi:fused signal recognition particle receptor|uniref:signal recognition particle-docking protein FtsY n=1 Tax=methanotrophic endosymbiont of Bathymodiolus puteoserpentis (Logatchev) TaxID=343235 RepID=UPI0013C9657B|nr:signal recognition particle-docking protein FtsY [methanotrophic endosymbiont of Bathymodiolus puteoserpentis (Logatchev)]SHE22812.1 Signal recognition particle receptor protein FtsY (=alpha subunit) (TC 3.A.5.1.1) [methanotrophic endosymbiont of Bathymodiolus puteoserpentis (Logatchev)]